MSDRTGKETRADLSKRRTLTKLGVDGGAPRQAGKSAKPVDKGELTSTPVNSLPPRSRTAAKTGCQSPLHVDSARRRTEASVSALNETPRMMGTRRSAAEFRTPECFSAVAFETPGAQLKLKKTFAEADDDNLELQTHSSSVTVAVRVRPFMMRLVFA